MAEVAEGDETPVSNVNESSEKSTPPLVKSEPAEESTTSESTEETTPSTTPVTKNNSCSIIWEWEGDGSTWTSFSPVHTKALDDGFKGGMLKMDILVHDMKFNIIFERMVQRNSKTYWERRIRARNGGDEDDGGLSGKYQYYQSNLNGVGKWVSYDHVGQRLIHASLLYKVKANFYTKGTRFVIDTEAMQQLNTKTKDSDCVRLKPEGDVEDDEEMEANNIEAEEKPPRKVSGRGKKKENQSPPSGSGAGNLKVESDIDEMDARRTKSMKSTKRKVETEDTEVVKTISITGKAPVDEECFVRNKYHVYYEGKIVYDAMLNQTNLKNNNNKFYLMQILQANSGGGFAVWFRWGRVGMIGQSNLTSCGNDLDKAKELFCGKFELKTKNDFGSKSKFKKVEGKYDLVLLDYSKTEKGDEVDAPDTKKQKTVPPSKLDAKLRALIELICSVKEMEQAVLEMKYDAKKAPLGKLNKEQIKNGYKALKKIEQCISSGSKSRDELIKACDAFYTRVPHCYGMQRLPVISTKQEIKKKIELLEILGDIEIAMKVMSEGTNSLENPVDQHYLALGCQLKPLPHTSTEFNIINKYTQQTHATTHNQYNMQVLDVFQIDDPRQQSQYNDLGNKMLLWHGSRLTNFVGILSRGLRVAPPEAPVTGYMFGKGIYFADISSKSANYCYPTRSRNVGFTMLCEVSLGKTNDLLAADYEADKLVDGCNSTKGLGKVAPDTNDFDTLPDGVVVPCGAPVDTGVENPDGYTLNYNEYVVYDPRQVKSRYLVQIKFNFN